MTDRATKHAIAEVAIGYKREIKDLQLEVERQDLEIESLRKKLYDANRAIEVLKRDKCDRTSVSSQVD